MDAEKDPGDVMTDHKMNITGPGLVRAPHQGDDLLLALGTGSSRQGLRVSRLNHIQVVNFAHARGLDLKGDIGAFEAVHQRHHIGIGQVLLRHKQHPCICQSAELAQFVIESPRFSRRSQQV